MNRPRRHKPRQILSADFNRLFYANIALAAVVWAWWNRGWPAHEMMMHMAIGEAVLNLAGFALLAFAVGIGTAWAWFVVLTWLGIVDVRPDDGPGSR